LLSISQEIKYRVSYALIELKLNLWWRGPVIREGRTFSGVDAVIDMGLASAKLAEEVGVDIFLIATDVKRIAINYGKPDQKFLSANSAKLFLHEPYVFRFAALFRSLIRAG